MSATNFDLIVVGGGLGGSAIAQAMAKSGARVLILEREQHFRDRVRGEGLAPWGAAEAKLLGIYEMLLKTCAFERRWVLGSSPDRDTIATTPQKLPLLVFSHPEMQERMLSAAAESGAEVRRGVLVKWITAGRRPRVHFESASGVEYADARMVVAADGRGSAARGWGTFATKHDRERLLIAGVLLDGLEGMKDEASYFFFNPDIAQSSFLFPQNVGRTRVYVGYRVESEYRLHGRESLARFIEESVRCGVPTEFYAKANIAGPLATFNGADSWVEHPYRNGIALIGDAAATSDPTWGQGMPLTLRDTRVLRDALLADDDWDRAGHSYASEHDRYYCATHTFEDWQTELFFGTSAEAQIRRAKALPLISGDPTRVPDYILSGPEVTLDDTVRARFYGEQ
jgi:menaquinone-9 beta-reductase